MGKSKDLATMASDGFTFTGPANLDPPYQAQHFFRVVPTLPSPQELHFIDR